jgi:hypothetical protein
MDNIDNDSVLDETCPGKSSWSNWERVDISAFKNSSTSVMTLPKPRYICQMRMEIGGNPLFVLGVFATILLNISNTEENKNMSSNEEIPEICTSLGMAKDDPLLNIVTKAPWKHEDKHFSKCEKGHILIHVVGALLGIVASLGFFIDALTNTQPMIAPDYIHMAAGVSGNMVMGTYLYDAVFLRIKATYDGVYKDMKSISGSITPVKDGQLFGESPKSFKSEKKLKQWIIVRQLLLEKIEPEYQYASISLTIVVIGGLYFVTFMLIRVAMEQAGDGRTPLQTLSRNSQNFSAAFGMTIVLSTWSINVLSQIISIGEEQQNHANILRKGAFACKLKNKDQEIGKAIAEIAETCADHIENLDVYPKAILSLEIRPSTVYAIFGYFLSSACAFIITQATSSGKTDEDSDINENILIGILVSLGIPAVYIFFHVVANKFAVKKK